MADEEGRGAEVEREGDAARPHPSAAGRFDAKLRKKVCRNVPWKSLVVEKLGQAVADWFRKLHPPRVLFEVDVVEHAVEPLWKGKDDHAIDVH